MAGIKARLGKAKWNWADELDSVLWAYHTSSKMATGEAPFNLVYGSTTVVPAEVEVKSHRILNYDEYQNLGLLRENLDLIGKLRMEAQPKQSTINSKCEMPITRWFRSDDLQRGSCAENGRCPQANW